MVVAGFLRRLGSQSPRGLVRSLEAYEGIRLRELCPYLNPEWPLIAPLLHRCESPESQESPDPHPISILQASWEL